MHHAEFPQIWPTTAFLPQCWLYGSGQFKKAAQTRAVQSLIVVRMAYLWATGCSLIGRGGAAAIMSSISLTTKTTTAFQFFDDFRKIEEAWSNSEVAEANALKKQQEKNGQPQENDQPPGVVLKLADYLDKSIPPHQCSIVHVGLDGTAGISMV